nr:hypothetical protein [uncultured Roseateles sp.]
MNITPPPSIATRETLDQNCELGVNSLVYDPHGLLAAQAFNLDRGDRLLLIEERLTVGDLMVAEAWASELRGSVLFVQTINDSFAQLCAGLLFEYVAQKAIAQCLAEVETYPADLQPGQLMQMMATSSEGTSMVLQGMRS